MRVDELFGKTPVTATDLQMKQDMVNRQVRAVAMMQNANLNSMQAQLQNSITGTYATPPVLRNPNIVYDDDAATITICISKVSNGNVVRIGQLQRVVYESDNLIDAIGALYTQHKMGVK